MRRSVQMMRVLLVLISCICAGCGSTGAATSRERDPPSLELHTWILPSCPSAWEEHPHGWVRDALNFMTVVPTVTVERGVVALVDRRDRGVKVMTSNSSGYLWWSGRDGTPGMASCAVFVVSASDPATWCELPDSPFVEARDGAVCNYFRAAKTSSVAKELSSVTWTGSGLPRFYAEIRLQPAADQEGVVPKGALYYYPANLGHGRFGSRSKRSLLLTVSAATDEGNVPALGDVVLPLTDIVPSNELVPVPQLPPSSIVHSSKVLGLRVPQKVKPESALMAVKFAGSLLEAPSSKTVLDRAAAVAGDGKQSPRVAPTVGR